jgi:hypothetical protein
MLSDQHADLYREVRRKPGVVGVAGVVSPLSESCLDEELFDPRDRRLGLFALPLSQQLQAGA